MTIKLYGAPLSNYYNMVRLSLMEKGLDFEEVPTRPSQEADFLAKSPMGKIPCIETGDGCLAETHVIMDYLEELKPSPALHPSGRYARARARQVMSICEIYIDLVARRHLASVVFGAPRSDEATEQVRPAIEAGLRAFERTATLDPYVAGADFGFADIYAYYAFGLASMLMQAVYDWDVIPQVPGLAACLDLTRQRETTQQCDAAQQQALAALRSQS
jgi:glutathione S-transferase